MKINKHTFRIAALSTVFVLGISLIVATNKPYKENDAYSGTSPTTTIDLNDYSESEIRTYYQNLNSLSVSERQGTNLLKHLKPILMNGQKYFNYDSGDNIWKLYEIIDRDWEKSPASAISHGTYSSSTNTITNYVYGSNGDNPYLHALYVDRDIDNLTRAWDGHTNETKWGMNREHIWAKSHGFQANGQGGARGDPMHLWAANAHANGIHSNNFYAFVDKTQSYTDAGTKYDNVPNNLSGKSKNAGGTQEVFEPQDCDKGDIARACFYMVARYNNYAGDDNNIDTNNPNLVLANSLSENSTTGTSTSSRAYAMGLLSDLLAWNKLDPVDEFEIHRNNLLYRNFTKNRNPFIDFPEWADAIWGTANLDGTNYNSTVTTYANPSSDPIGSSTVTPVFSISNTQLSLQVGGTTTISARNADGNITWSIANGAIASLNKTTTTNNQPITITALSAGSTTITATNGNQSLTCNLTVTEQVMEISLNKSTASVEVGQTTTLVATTTPNNAQVTWLSSDEDVATVSNGVVTGVSAGTAVITAKLSDSVKAQCTITVTDSGSMTGDYVKVASYDFGSTGTSSNATYSTDNLSQRFANSVQTGTGLSNIVAGITSATNVYPGYSGHDSYGLKLGSSGSNGSFTATLDRQVSRVIIKTAAWSTTDTVSVGGADAQTPGVAYSSANSIKTLTFDFDESDSVTFVYAKRGFIQTIDFYATGEVADNPRNHLNNAMQVSYLTADETVAGTESAIGEITFASLNLENGVQYLDPFTIAEGVTVTFSGGENDGKYYDTGSGIRTYGNGSFTIASGNGITQIELIFSGSNKPSANNVVDTGSYNSDTSIWTGSANSVTFTRPSGSGHWRLQKITVTYGGQSVTVDNVKMRFGAAIPVEDWYDIEASWDVDYYGVMFLKYDTLHNTYGYSSIEEAYEDGIRPRADVHTNEGDMPLPLNGLLIFTARINMTSELNYGVVYVAAPYIVIDGIHYFLEEMEYSVNSMAQEYLDNDLDSTLSNAALTKLATPTSQGD